MTHIVIAMKTEVKTEIFTAANRNEARKIAAESFCVIKNKDNVLPLKNQEQLR